MTDNCEPLTFSIQLYLHFLLNIRYAHQWPRLHNLPALISLKYTPFLRSRQNFLDFSLPQAICFVAWLVYLVHPSFPQSSSTKSIFSLSHLLWHPLLLQCSSRSQIDWFFTFLVERVSSGPVTPGSSAWYVHKKPSPFFPNGSCYSYHKAFDLFFRWKRLLI